MKEYRIRNMDDYTIREMTLDVSQDPMKEFLDKVRLEKDNLIAKEILTILSKHYEEYKNATIKDYTIHDLITILQDMELILDIEEPELNMCETQQNPLTLDYNVRWTMSSPKVKLYKRLE